MPQQNQAERFSFTEQFTLRWILALGHQFGGSFDHNLNIQIDNFERKKEGYLCSLSVLKKKTL